MICDVEKGIIYYYYVFYMFYNNILILFIGEKIVIEYVIFEK